jgi:hypothetical protein
MADDIRGGTPMATSAIGLILFVVPNKSDSELF